MRLSLSRSSLGSVPPVDLLDVGDRARKVGEFTGIFLKLGRVDTLRARSKRVTTLGGCAATSAILQDREPPASEPA